MIGAKGHDFKRPRGYDAGSAWCRRMTQSEAEEPLCLEHRGRQLAVLSVMLLLAAGVRLHYLDASLINGEHQYQSAMIARQYFFEAGDSIPQWRKDVVAAALSHQRVLEPPVFPVLASLGYRVLGRETLTLPRLMTMLTWLLGGVCLFLLTKRLASTDAAYVAAAYFMFVPSGVELSVAFLPDAPMVMLMVMGLFATVLFFERPSPARFAAAWMISGAAIVIKPVCLFPIAGGIIGLAMHGRRSPGWSKRLASGAALLIVAVSSGSMYYLWHILRGGELAVQADTSFVPSLLLHRSYWEGWLESAGWAVGFGPLVVAILGLAAMRTGPRRAFAIGLWGSYATYCLLFTYHITFAGHYHLLLVPIVALSLSPLVPPFLRFGQAITGSWFGRGLCVILLLLTLATALRTIRQTFQGAAFESPRIAAAIGEIVQHSTRTVFLSPFYGAPLEYYGELAGVWWPRAQREWPLRTAEQSERSIRDRFRTLGFEPEYFIITDLSALRTHEWELEAFLSQHCTLLARSPEYFVYGLRECLQPF